jgi:hypothetical protein
MAENNSTHAGDLPEPDATFKPFSWLYDGAELDQYGRFAGRTMDVCRGIHACLELINSSDLSRTNGDAPLLGAFHTSALLRFAMASAELLGDDVDQSIDWINKRSLKEKAPAKAHSKDKPVTA